MNIPKHFLSAIGPKSEWELVFRSPGRINIIGEHTDYNGGLVLPAAIQQAIYFAVRPSKDNSYHFTALDVEDQVHLSELPTAKTGNMWVDYLCGVADQFRQRGFELPAIEVVFGGNLPQGAGVSSSAALEGGMAFLCNELTKASFDRPELARICNQSSNQFMGIPSGVMDQFASLNGRKNQAMLLDCNTLEHEFVSAEIPGYAFVLVNSEVSHQLANSEYPVRVAECREGLKILQKHYPELEALSHAKPAMVEAHKEAFRPVVYQRCRYVAGESIRIKAAVDALRAKDALTLGKQLNATHVGLRDDYEVSCQEVDFLQSFAQQYEGVAGSRIMGGGFGGCTINLIEAEQVDAFIKDITAAYRAAFGIDACYFVSQIDDGTSLIQSTSISS